MGKLKSHKGLLKRIRITGTGKVKFKRAFSSHLNSHMTGDKIRKLKQKRCAKRGDIGRLEAMLHRRLTPAD